MNSACLWIVIKYQTKHMCMKKTIFTVFTALLFAVPCCGQLVYHDAASFPLLGRATECTPTRYERLPDSLEHISRQPLWELGRNSAGLAVRFRTNSTCVAAKWQVRTSMRMNHMTDTGIKGLDLYCLMDDGHWAFAGSGRPQGQDNEATLAANMSPREREFMLYLSLYDGVTSLQIGVDSLAQLDMPQVDLPHREKPIVFYGTSILQGGCASRPGMAHTNILQRWLNRECINLGFSGNGQLDLEIAHVMAGVDASVFVLDFMPNVTIEQLRDRAIKFYDIIRAKRPDTPVLFVENPIFTTSTLDEKVAREVKEKNAVLREIVDALERRGEKNIRYLPADDLIGHDGEATVDGVHYTDLGFMRYAEVLRPLLEDMMD